MTVMFHDTPGPVLPDQRLAVVYHDAERPSLDTLEALLDRPRGPWVKTIHTGKELDRLPDHLRGYLPAPPREEVEYPLVVAVYEGDVVSWTGHQPQQLEAWVTQPHTVAAYLTRSADRTQALDEGKVSYWDIPSAMLGHRTTTV